MFGWSLIKTSELEKLHQDNQMLQKRWCDIFSKLILISNILGLPDEVVTKNYADFCRLLNNTMKEDRNNDTHN